MKILRINDDVMLHLTGEEATQIRYVLDQGASQMNLGIVKGHDKRATEIVKLAFRDRPSTQAMQNGISKGVKNGP